MVTRSALIEYELTRTRGYAQPIEEVDAGMAVWLASDQVRGVEGFLTFDDTEYVVSGWQVTCLPPRGLGPRSRRLGKPGTVEWCHADAVKLHDVVFVRNGWNRVVRMMLDEHDTTVWWGKASTAEQVIYPNDHVVRVVRAPRVRTA